MADDEQVKTESTIVTKFAKGKTNLLLLGVPLIKKTTHTKKLKYKTKGKNSCQKLRWCQYS